MTPPPFPFAVPYCYLYAQQLESMRKCILHRQKSNCILQTLQLLSQRTNVNGTVNVIQNVLATSHWRIKNIEMKIIHFCQNSFDKFKSLAQRLHCQGTSRSMELPAIYHTQCVPWRTFHTICPQRRSFGFNSFGFISCQVQAGLFVFILNQLNCL
jgi:hypothetical protein